MDPEQLKIALSILSGRKGRNPSGDPITVEELATLGLEVDAVGTDDAFWDPLLQLCETIVFDAIAPEQADTTELDQLASDATDAAMA